MRGIWGGACMDWGIREGAFYPVSYLVWGGMYGWGHEGGGLLD